MILIKWLHSYKKKCSQPWSAASTRAKQHRKGN